jgi:hypothetical protein
MRKTTADAFQELGEAKDRLIEAIYEALKMKQILDWLTKQIAKW